MDETVQLIDRAFDLASTIYKKQLNEFYPTVGDRGITEANQVHLFTTALRQVDANVYSWLEVPFPTKDNSRARLDGAAFCGDMNSSWLGLIEAKRIKQGCTRGRPNTEIAFEQIAADAERMGEPDRIKTFTERLNDVKAEHTRLYRIFLADIWINNDPVMKDAADKWLTGDVFPTDWRTGYFKKSAPIFTFKKDSSVLHTLIAVHPSADTVAQVVNNI